LADRERDDVTTDPRNPRDSAERRIEKLERINAVLIDRVERAMEHQANAYSLFQTAIGLETQVRARTEELKYALNRLERLNHELTAARDAAEQANRFKTRFFTAVGHDLLQPLHAARLSLSALTETEAAVGDRQLVRQIDHALTSVEEILRTILDISRLESGVIKPDPRALRVADVYQVLAASAEPLAKAKGLSLSYRAGDFAIVSDPLMLRRILQNLLANAVHYTQSGRVLLAARRRGHTVRLEVWDTGPGIDIDEQQVIFEEFQRGSSSDGQRPAGFGLGLSIVQRMADALGHPIAVCSKPGYGSCFMVTAPYAGRGVELAKPAPPVSATATYGFPGNRIVLIENDVTVRDAMRTLLERWGCSVRTAASIAEVEQIVADPDYSADLVVADYHLDYGECGLTGVARLRAGREDLPAIVVTADHSEETAEEARGSGCEILRKPVRPAELRALMQYMLS
jgi:signal transduction histidine kinase/CheY-like chemotaxis protein